METFTKSFFKKEILPVMSFVLGIFTFNTAIAQGEGGIDEERNDKTVTANHWQPLFEKTGVQEEIYTKNPTQEIYISAKGGTKITVPGNAFTDANGNTPHGPVEIRFIEATKRSDLLLSNLPSASDGDMLVSGGVIKIEARAGGKELILAPGKSIEVNFPGGNETGMELFDGEYDVSGKMNWKPQSENKPDPNMIREKLNIPGMEDYGLIDPKTYSCTDGKHSMLGYFNEMLKRYYPCVGVDAIYLEVKINKNGYVIGVKPLTGKCDCYMKALTEIAFTLQFTPMTTGKAIYFEVKPAIPASRVAGENVFVSILDNPAFPASAELRDWIKRAEELKRIDAELKRIDNYGRNVFKVTKLGWINCDRFYQTTQPKVNVVAKMNTQDVVDMTKAFLVFDNLNSVMEGSVDASGNVHFGNIPSNLNAKIVLISYLPGNKIFLANEKITTGTTANIVLTSRPVNESELKTVVAGL